MTRMRAMWMGLALAVALPAWAGLEPALGKCGESSCLWQEPVVSAPQGWALKTFASSHYHAKAFAPAGSNFENAPAVMYAKAVSKQGGPATLAGFMAQDIA